MRTTTDLLKRFALLDRNSGVVFGTADAASAIEACRIVDAEIGEVGREYIEVNDFDALRDSGYYVHTAPDGWSYGDGTDTDIIAEVEAMPLAVCVHIPLGDDC